MGILRQGILAAIFLLLLASPLHADIIYTVEDGDCAWSIALHFGVSLEDLYEANRWASDENPVLQVGQRIAIPSDREDETSDTEEESGTEEVTGETTYIVQPGDNPYLIAHRFGIGTLPLLEYNGLMEGELIHPGRLLSIPPSDYEYQGNAEAEEDSEEEEDAPEPLRYRVQAGDNPWAIARRFGVNLQTLLSYNGLTESALLHVGDELLIPADASWLSSRSFGWATHTVIAGDTFSEIAVSYGVPLAALVEANNLSAQSTLQVGQELIVPGYRAAPEPEGEQPSYEFSPVPSPPEDLSDALEPLPSLGQGGGESSEEAPGWRSDIFDFSRITPPEPSTPDPAQADSGELSVDGHFDDGTPYHLYAVRRGDTISRVAHSFGVTQSTLIDRNGLDIRTPLRIGRDLKIPLPRPAAPAEAGTVNYGAPDVPIGAGQGSDLSLAVVEEAMNHLGTRYVWSGTSLTGGVDCSGFTMAVFAQFGVDLPHRSRDQAECGITVEYEDLQPADLVCFHTTRSGISHVGIYIGNGEFVHSSSHRGGVVVSPMDTGYYNRRFVCARRLL